MKKPSFLGALLATFALTASALHAAAYGAAPTPASAPAPARPAPATTGASGAAAPAMAPAKAPDAASVGTPGTGPAFKVNLSPPTKGGQKASIVTDITNSQHIDALITIPGSAPIKQPNIQDVSVHLEGEAEVLAVFPNGGVRKVAVIVKVLTATQNGVPVPGLPKPGAKIVGEAVGAAKNITIDDKPASAALSQILSNSLGLDNAKHTDQDMFGPKDPEAVGATWPANAALFVEAFKEETGSDMSGITGLMKLDAVKGAGDDQVISISGNYNVAGVKPPMPPIITIDSTALKLTVTGSIPATSTKGVLKKSIMTSMSFTGHGAVSGGAMSMTGVVEEKESGEVTYH